MNTISTPRLAGFIVLTLVVVIGTLGFGCAVGSCQSPEIASPSPVMEPSATPTSAPVTGAPDQLASDLPAVGRTIPPIVPVPSGPNP
jgi:hypothetical protein